MHDHVGAIVTESDVSDLISRHGDNDEKLNEDKDKEGDAPQDPVDRDPTLALLQQLAGHLDKELHHEKEDHGAAAFLKRLQKYARHLRRECVVAENH